MCENAITSALMGWYDNNARTLAWRVPPGSTGHADPFRVWLSEIMLQQTTVATVDAYYREFLSRWPTVIDLAVAPDDEVLAAWAGLGYYARARNLLRCARVVTEQYAGVFPNTFAGLRALPGIGPYTAAAVASIAFGQPHAVLDGNVERVMARLYDVDLPLPQAKVVLQERAQNLLPTARPGDFNQALMDIGATVCKPRNPTCGRCPLSTECQSRVAGTIAERPVRAPKVPKPTRTGHAYVFSDPDGAWLLERRPENGLLGGMLGWPGSDWTTDAKPAPPFAVDWQVLGEKVRHSFTHFHLILTIHRATGRIPPNFDPNVLLKPTDFRRADLPTVMRKIYDVATMPQREN